MKRVILGASFIIVVLVQAQAYHNFYSDPEATTVTHPIYSETILQKSYTIATPNPSNLDYGANWIWSNGSTRIATFETLFYTHKSGVASLRVMANSSYYAYVNGVSVRSGFKNLTTDVTQVYLKCGLNNLTINAENNDTKAVSGGVVFQIAQYLGSLNCANNGFYNYSSCACQCLGSFTCSAGQIAVGYPTCGCKCVNEGVLTCNSNNMYYDQKTCSCKCILKYCRPGFEQDPSTCGCRCTAKTCTKGKWNYNQCACL